MQTKQRVIEAIHREKFIAILRGFQPETAVKIAEAIYEGGVRLIEIPFEMEGKDGGARELQTIQMLVDRFSSRAIIGAGTVLQPEQAVEAAKAGAQFILSPNFSEAVIQKTNALGLVSIPGAFTPTEAYNAYALGADFVKLFPAGNLTEAYIKAIRGPLSKIPLIAVGGIGEENAAAFLRSGAVAVAAGGKLCNAAAVKNEDFSALTVAAKNMIAALKCEKE